MKIVEKLNPSLMSEGISYASYKICEESKLYNYYKEGQFSFNDEQILEIDILLLLEKLGFPMDELGTYLYKDLIKEVVDLLVKGAVEENIISDLQNFFSSIYRWASDEKEIGVKIFNKLIVEAINEINPNNVDKTLDLDIMSFENLDKNYGVLAFEIAKRVDVIQSKSDSKVRQLKSDK